MSELIKEIDSMLDEEDTMKAVLKIELEFDLPKMSEDEAIQYLENIELPSKYKEDSFEILSIDGNPIA